MLPKLSQRYVAHMLKADEDVLREMCLLRAEDLDERRTELNDTLGYLRMAAIAQDWSVMADRGTGCLLFARSGEWWIIFIFRRKVYIRTYVGLFR